MSLPDGWEWLDEIPPAWSPPAELRTPTGVLRVDLSIPMVSRNSLGNDLIELVGQLLSESARFSIWFGSMAKKEVSPKQLALLSETTNEQLHHVYEAWVPYINAYEASGRRVGTFEAEEEALRCALSDAIRNLAETRKSNESD